MWRYAVSNIERVRGLQLWSVALALVVCLVAVACSGTDEGDEPTFEEEGAMLEAMSLQVGDLPPGLQQTESLTTTNEEAAAIQPDEEGALRRYDALGRVLAYKAAFLPTSEGLGDTILGVEIEVTLYEDSSGASRWFQDRVQDVQEQIDAVQSGGGSGLLELEIEELDLSGITAQSFGLTQSGFVEDDETSLRADHQLLFAVNRVGVFLRADAVVENGTDRTVYAEEVREWMELVVRRIGETLDSARRIGPRAAFV